MFQTWQVRSFFWRYLRGFHHALRVPIPTPRLLFFPILPNSKPIDPLGGGGSGRAVTTLDLLNFILSSLPTRWPLSMPLFVQRLVAVLAIALNAWVVFDLANDVVLNNEGMSVDTKCQAGSYDYVVVGAGTAGIVVATRIANASRNIRVLLLEAGGEPSIFNDVPCLDFYLMNQPANTWLDESLPQQHACQSCDGQRTVTTRGKMLGGSSSMNFMLYTRGNKEDFNRWSIDTLDEQWNYKNVLPAFKKSEDYHGAYASEESSEEFHGKGGLLNIATHNHMPPGVEDFLAAGVEKNYAIGDYNGADQLVFSKMDVTTQDGWRESVYRAFYQITGKPPNLCIKKFAQVVKINFDHSGDNGNIRATGVTYRRHDNVRSVIATKEVIISAGTFGTPKLLMLSGVGPSGRLEELRITLVRDAPVGENLQDHLFTLVGPFLRGPTSIGSRRDRNRNFNLAKAAFFMMNEDGDGAGPAPVGLAGHAFFQSPVAQPAYPDLQAIQMSVQINSETSHLLHGILGSKESALKEWLHFFSHHNLDASFVLLLLGRPRSVGQLTLASVDPNVNLIIEPNYLSHPDDREALLLGFKEVLELFENTTVLNTPLLPKPVPGCEQERFKSDEYFNCVIKHLSGSFYQHVGTCALGKVVDSRLRVNGIDGLRVIDASVIPRSPNGNTQAATIMIGEKGAEFIISEMMEHEIIESNGEGIL